MYQLIIILCRYVFVFYIAYFLWQGVAYIINERGIRSSVGRLAVAKQRVTVVFMHLTAFLLLAYVPSAYSFDPLTLVTGAGGLAFILAFHFASEKVYKGSCPLIWNGIMFLADVSLIMLVRMRPELAQKQLIWFIIGALAALTIPLLLMLTPRFEKLEIVYLIVGYVFILLPFFLSTITNGALNWIEIGGYSLQPSEIVKFLLVFYLASVFRKKRTLPQLALPSLFSAGLVLILVMQRDLGGALIFFMTFMIMLYISSGSELLFLLGMGLAALGSVGAYQIFAHVRVRVESWQNPWLHADAGGYQILQSLFAIGTWGLWGSGLTRGMPNSIPVHESDFMFAALCEELGPLFAVGIIGVFIMIFYRGVHISLRCKRRYYSLIAAGLTSMLTFQTFLIIGGNIKLIPLTGVTLPFLSYGGSSVIVSMLMVGFLQWLYISTFHEEEPASEENRRERQEHPAGAGKPKAGRRKTKRNEGTEAKQGKRGDENE